MTSSGHLKPAQLLIRLVSHLSNPRPPTREERRRLEEMADGVERQLSLDETLSTPLAAGWWMAEIRIDDPAGAGNAGLMLRYRTGIDDQRLLLPFHSGQTSKRLFYNAAAPHSAILELPPGARPVTLRFSPVTGRFARDRMLRRVRRHTPAFAPLPFGAVRDAIAHQAGEQGYPPEQYLCRLYDGTFLPRQASCQDAYQGWIARREPSLFRYRVDAPPLARQPLVSVVMPVFDSHPDHLLRAIQSVRAQYYTNWELCIADDASRDPRLRPLLDRQALEDSRIRVVYRDCNGHISRATNSALELARGEYVAFLDHDDELSPHALYEVAAALDQAPWLEIIYSDEDFLDSGGRRVNPHFKSDWNPHLLYCHNYVTHLCVYSRELVERAGGLRQGVEGAQDYDLLLRCARLTTPDRIHHIPKILYHWRMAEGSTARAGEEKPYTVEAGRRALLDHFASEGRQVEVTATAMDNFYRVTWLYPDPPPLVTVIVPTRDRLELLRPCLDSVLQLTRYPRFELLVLDNDSRDQATLDYLERLQRDPRVRVVRCAGPFNFSAINNRGVEMAAGEMVCLLNNDTRVITPEWLDEMVMLARDQATGCVGAKLYYEDDTIQHAGVIIGLGGYAAHSHREFPRDSRGYFNRLRVRQNVSAVTGACLLVRKSVFNEVGGLDERLTVAYNDVDFCLRVQEAGYFNVFTPFAELYHYESKSRGAENTPERIKRFTEEKRYLHDRWGEQLKRDPFYNPNLTHSREDFSIGQ